MIPLRTRRSILGALPIVLAGCTTSRSDDESGTEGIEAGSGSEASTATTPTATATTTTSERETATTTVSGVERLPEPSPLAGTLVGIVEAEDRASYADGHDLDFRDGRVRVEVSLVPDGTPPEQYLPEDRTVYEDTVIAYVYVRHLVDLALHDDVRFVAPYIAPEPDPESG